MHTIEENQEEPEAVAGGEALEIDEWVRPAEYTKKVPLCEDVLDHTVIVGRGLEEAEVARLMVPKKIGKLRMCIDFTNLNKACSKDDYRYLRLTL